MSPLLIVPIQLGPLENNTYLFADTASKLAIAVDPSFDSEVVLEEAQRRGWQITAIWLTHAHFDHIAGVKTLAESAEPNLPIGLHPEDLPLYRQSGGAGLFGLSISPGAEPKVAFTHGQVLELGSEMVEVRHAPGHTPGHVIFYLPAAQAALTGDVIFYHGVGRTDLPGGDHAALMRSIREQVLTLPPETRLLSGHGPETSVEEETAENPFL